ncbi:MAG: hypothetical protein COT18_13020 [Elusimicrobia bacterium CG08_land_8_20_14_0_20_59_10]|nr:MAG: hypothetical protein COT18_13020 [Elusimicrobia bacterium CG08_land_8_20_14_0_20_59_10]
MLKLLLLAVLFPSGASAAQGPLDLGNINFSAITAFQSPAARAVAVPYRLDEPDGDRYFNAYMLKAVSYLYANYGLKGYDISSILTHDIVYHTFGTLTARHPPLTMCVAAQMEVILTAFRLYAEETGDYSVYEYLPKRSFEGLRVTDLKGHIWVNHAFKAYGTADALINFGMGERRLFEDLKPGDFVNINRTTRTGHAVTFLDFINDKGEIQPEYNDTVVGFKYFSSQGRKEEGLGGFDFRYAVFSSFGCPEMPYKRDCNVIYSTDQVYLNTGVMLSPKYWTHVMPAEDPAAGETVFNRSYFNGLTTDD